jgi:hypothetical protein
MGCAAAADALDDDADDPDDDPDGGVVDDDDGGDRDGGAAGRRGGTRPPWGATARGSTPAPWPIRRVVGYVGRMKHAVPHDLPPDLARKAAEAALKAYAERFAEYDPRVTWTGDNAAEVAFSAKGVTLKGTFAILADRIEMEMEVPLLLRMFRQKALDVVEGEILAWVQKAKDGLL